MLHRVQASTSAFGAPGLASLCEIKCYPVFVEPKTRGIYTH